MCYADCHPSLRGPLGREVTSRGVSALTRWREVWQATPVRCLTATALLLTCAACATIDPGDNFVPPDVVIDESFFFCRIQPEVVAATRCASGISGEGGSCHSSRSALRLDPLGETVLPPECDGNTPTGPIPESYRRNLDAVRFTVQSDPLSSPFYRRPVQLDAHARKIFDEDSPEAMLIFEWLTTGGP